MSMSEEEVKKIEGQVVPVGSGPKDSRFVWGDAEPKVAGDIQPSAVPSPQGGVQPKSAGVAQVAPATEEPRVERTEVIPRREDRAKPDAQAMKDSAVLSNAKGVASDEVKAPVRKRMRDYLTHHSEPVADDTQITPPERWGEQAAEKSSGTPPTEVGVTSPGNPSSSGAADAPQKGKESSSGTVEPSQKGTDVSSGTTGQGTPSVSSSAPVVSSASDDDDDDDDDGEWGGVSAGVGSSLMPSEEEYQAAKSRVADAEKRRVPASKADRETVFLHDNPRPKIPTLDADALEQYVPDDVPEIKETWSNYENAYKLMQKKMKEAGDDPASRAKRAKAIRAAKVIAIMGDVLQASLNMWGAYRGASSAKLSSQSKSVREAEAAEESRYLKRAAQYSKDLEHAIERDEKVNKANADRLLSIWKERNRGKSSAVTEKNKAFIASHNAKVREALNDLSSWNRRFERIGQDTATEVRQYNQHQNAVARQNNQYRNQRALNDQRGAITRQNQENASRLRREEKREAADQW